MPEMSLLHLVTGALGLFVLLLGQRIPKLTQFGVGFGLCAGGYSYWAGIPNDGVTTASFLGIGVLGGLLVLVVRRLLPLTLGAIVGSYVAWCVVQFGWGIDLFRAHPDWLAGVSFGVSFIGVVVLNRLIVVTERISIAITGAVLLGASLGLVNRIEWVAGFALASLAIDGLRRD